MEVYEMTIDESGEFGLQAISLVEKPAIKEDFIALSEQKEFIHLKSIDDEKRLVMGAALVPNMLIDRVDKGKAYQIYFTEDTIRKSAQNYLIYGQQSNATIEHQRKLIEGVHLVESWIVEDSEMDKSAYYGLSYVKGTWVVALKIVDDVVWNDYVKTGKVKGFSIEGTFLKVPKLEMSELSEVDIIAKDISTLIDGLVEKK